MATNYLQLTNEILRELNDFVNFTNFASAVGFQQFVKIQLINLFLILLMKNLSYHFSAGLSGTETFFMVIQL